MQNEKWRGWPEGYGRRILNSCDSTLNVASRLAVELSAPEWILAYEQTAARGRRGRKWKMPEGNFAATLLMPVDQSPARAALRSFVASLALRDTFVALSGHEGIFELKWPNDVLLRGGKVAGILLETVVHSNVITHLAIGIGVNLSQAPAAEGLEKDALPAVALRTELGIAVSPEEFLTVLAASFARYETQFRAYGFEPIRHQWLKHAARIGEVIRARTLNDEKLGVFREIDASGQLVLETAEGRLVIPAADVYF